MKASVITPTFNRRPIVLRTIRTLIDQNFPPSEYEIIVVVDGSTDGTSAALKVIQPPCRFRVIEQENLGPAAARNAGIRAAENELLIFIDDDMLCDSMLVREHCDAHLHDGPGMVGVGAILLSPDSPPTLASECFKREVGAYSLQQKLSPGVSVPRIFGNSSITRQLLNEVGGFDERYRMREDAELFARLAARGARIHGVPGAIANQYYTKTASDLIRDAEKFAAADLLFVHDHPNLAGETLLGKVAAEPAWKRITRRMIAAWPFLPDACLACICRLSDMFPSRRTLRDLGIRALQARRVLRYHRKIFDLSARSVGMETPPRSERGA